MAKREIEDYTGVVKTNQFPSNSTKKKPVENKDKNVEKMVAGGVKRKKKSIGKKFASSFFSEDIDNLGQYIIHDVILPGAKEVIYNMFVTGLGMSLFGNAHPPKGISRYGAKSVVNYSGISQKSHKPSMSNRARAAHDFDDIVMDDKWDAENVLSKMVELIEVYDQVTVGDMYDLVGISSSFADQKYGWTNLNSARVDRDRDGYRLVLPRAEVL